MRVGIIFGGSSREREISFAGGRTVYDNLNKTLFTPLPLFLDSLGNIIELDWPYLYKGTIRDFYPPVQFIPKSESEYQIYAESLPHLTTSEIEEMISKVGKKVTLSELKSKIDFAFLCLHGSFGEDGQIQGILEYLKIPYTGSGILPSAIGMDKSFQKKMMEHAGFSVPQVIVLSKEKWRQQELQQLYHKIESEIGFPCVIRPANQGSSIGVSILSSEALITDLDRAMHLAFFCFSWEKEAWTLLSQDAKQKFIKTHSDIREGLGLPIKISYQWIYTPTELLHFLENTSEEKLFLESKYTETKIIVESFIQGREFSCIVIRDEFGSAIALPPTEIIKGQQLYDYRSKYLPGLSRKVTPIEIEDQSIQNIRNECVRLFELFEFNTYARIDGFIQANGTIFLNDPNTTSGMLPSSFFFHQAAEIGLNPSQFLSYIIRTSIWERIQKQIEFSNNETLLKNLDDAIQQMKQTNQSRRPVAVIMGGYSFERHISMESGRNIYEKLSSSDKYIPIPVFLKGNPDSMELIQIPIHYMLKDNADDIRDKINDDKVHPAIQTIRQECQLLLKKYSSEDYSFQPKKLSFQELKENNYFAFIALHGRPGEDGTVQRECEKYGIPYNGSGPDSSMITIHKYNTLQLLKEHGFPVAKQLLMTKENYAVQRDSFLNQVFSEFNFPFIAKPVDDGCSSAVKKISSKETFAQYLDLLFRNDAAISDVERQQLSLEWNEEFPQKNEVLIEELISKKDCIQFLEITGGMLTHGNRKSFSYEIFEPSEALSSGEVLSLEEKFLAGEGQNLTPPRFGKNQEEYQQIASQVKASLLQAAKILNIQGYARIDAFVRIYDDLKAETIIIEVNSLPGMTPATCIFHQTAINGYKPYDFIDKIIEFGTNESN
ncbi:MAG: D-alanine--D-alanine ligase [Saprospiraceae bacterium]|nr:D-alanine--D-alanine ligase [Saprospiraceae bacterium]